MIQVDDLSLSYKGETIFDEASFTVGPKERVGLVGRNGSGKSSLLRLLVGQERPDSGQIALPKGYRLGYLDQHIRFHEPTVLQEGASGLREDEKDLFYKAEKILFGLGFDENQLEKAPSELSGGYHLRLHLAKVLLSEPDCLLLDEPTNYLDILSMQFLRRFLKSWPGALIMVSHDRDFLDSITTHTLGIHRKKISKIKGSTVDFYNMIVEKEEIHEKTRVNLEKKRAHMQSYIDRFGAKASKAAQAESRRKMLSRIPSLEALKSLYELDFNFRHLPFPGKKMVEASDLSFAYEADQKLIEGFSLTIERGDRIAIIGKNGYGKSTLVKLIQGELAPLQGSIKRAEKLSTGYFGQTHIQSLDANKTIEQEISQAHPALNFTEVRAIAGQMMFPSDSAKKKIGVLSGGEKSRVLLGKILARPVNLLLLDEPTHHLDIESIEALIDALEDFEGSYLIVTHSELILKRLDINKLIICREHKQMLFQGSYGDFLEKMGWEQEAPEKKKIAPPAPPKAKSPNREKEIARLEKAIAEKERVYNEHLQTLAALSQNSNPDREKIHALSTLSRRAEEEIELLYAELADLEGKR